MPGSSVFTLFEKEGARSAESVVQEAQLQRYIDGTVIDCEYCTWHFEMYANTGSVLRAHVSNV